MTQKNYEKIAEIIKIKTHPSEYGRMGSIDKSKINSVVINLKFIVSISPRKEEDEGFHVLHMDGGFSYFITSETKQQILKCCGVEE